MNLQEIKEDHAKELGYTDFEELFSECAHTGVDIFIDLIARKYATEKVKEALKFAAEKATIAENSWLNREGGYSFNHEVDKKSILSLETELIERINKEK